MKNTLNLLFLMMIVGVISIGCDKDEKTKMPCDSNTGLVITEQIGRIYKRTISQPNFYYIGNPQKVSSGINGGFIPCNELPEEFQVEDLIIIYSGVDKGTMPGPDDPMFGYITLTQIKKAN